MKWPGALPTAAALGTAALGAGATDREGTWNLNDCPPTPFGNPYLGQPLRTRSSSPGLLCFSISLSLSTSFLSLSTLPTPKFTQHPIFTLLLIFIPPCWNYQLTSTFPSSYVHSKLSSFRIGTVSTFPGYLGVRQGWFQKLLSK